MARVRSENGSSVTVLPLASETTTRGDGPNHDHPPDKGEFENRPVALAAVGSGYAHPLTPQPNPSGPAVRPAPTDVHHVSGQASGRTTAGELNSALVAGANALIQTASGNPLAATALGPAVIRALRSPEGRRFLYRAIFPYTYGGVGKIIGAPIQYFLPEQKKLASRYDAWAMYLGLPQEHGTLETSPYRPATSSDPGASYVRIKGHWEKLRSQECPNDARFIAFLAWNVGIVDEDTASLVMGTYKLGQGHDERGTYFSYYDRWDLDKSLEGKDGVIGKPFELYDRLYYNPNTKQIYWDGPPPPPPAALR